MTHRAGLAIGLAGLTLMALIVSHPQTVQTQGAERPRLAVKLVDDFEVTGTGDHAAWGQADWVTLRRRQAGGHPYDSRFKMVYSGRGIYLLFDAADRTLTATMQEDFMDLWNEDVFEAFFWTDERYPVYLEYQISPLNRELVILVPNFGGQFLGWQPWHYEGDRMTRKSTSTIGGPKESHASIERWRAEFFLPYTLFRPLQGVPPKPGTRWRANFYRMDYDGGSRTQWEWAPVGENFHEFEKFGDLVFEGR